MIKRSTSTGRLLPDATVVTGHVDIISHFFIITFIAKSWTDAAVFNFRRPAFPARPLENYQKPVGSTRKSRVNRYSGDDLVGFIHWHSTACRVTAKYQDYALRIRHQSGFIFISKRLYGFWFVLHHHKSHCHDRMHCHHWLDEMINNAQRNYLRQNQR